RLWLPGAGMDYWPACQDCESSFDHSVQKNRIRFLDLNTIDSIYLAQRGERVRVPQGVVLKLAEKAGAATKTGIILSGVIQDIDGELKDIKGMIVYYDEENNKLALYRYYRGNFGDLVAQLSQVKTEQEKKVKAIKAAAEAGEVLNFAGQTLFGLDLSGLDLRKLASVKDTDM